MTDISSTFKVTLTEFVDVTNWLCTKINGGISDEDIIPIVSKIELLAPIAEKTDQTFRNSSTVIDQDLVLSLENSCSNLWNSTVLNSKGNISPERQYMMFCVKYFTSILFLIFADLQHQSEAFLIRAFNCFNISLKSGLDLTSSQVYLEKTSRFMQKSEIMCDKVLQILIIKNTNSEHLIDLKIDFFITCLELSLLNKDFDTAKVYENKISELYNGSQNKQMSNKHIIEVSRCIYNSCLDHSSESFIICVYFLEKSLNFIELYDKNLNFDAEYNQIKCSTLTLLADYQLKQKSTDRCQKYLNILLNEFPTNMDVYKCGIKAVKQKFTLNDPSYIEEYKDILMKMIISVDIQQSIQDILGYFNDLATLSPQVAISCSDYLFVSKKLSEENNFNITETLFVNKLYIISQSVVLSDDAKTENLKNAFNLAAKTFNKNMTQTSVDSAVSLLWSTGKKYMKHDEYQLAIIWLDCCYHHLLKDLVFNKGIITRAMQKAYLGLKNYEKVEEMYQTMEHTEQIKPLTQILLFDAIANKNPLQLDFEKCMSCIEHIRVQDPNNFFDHLCVIFLSIKENDNLKLQILELLLEETTEKIYNNQHINETISYIRTTRLALQLYLKKFENSKDFKDEIIKYHSKFCNIVKQSLEFLKNTRVLQDLNVNINEKTKGSSYSYEEIEWFASISYNLAYTCFQKKIFISDFYLCDYAIEFIDLIKEKLDHDKQLLLDYRKIKCTSLSIFYKIQGQFLLPGDVDIYIELLNSIIKNSKEFIIKLKNIIGIEIAKLSIVECVLCLFNIHLFKKNLKDLLKMFEVQETCVLMSEEFMIDGFTNLLSYNNTINQNFKNVVLFEIIKVSISSQCNKQKVCELIRRFFEINIGLIPSDEIQQTMQTFYQSIKCVDSKFYLDAQYDIDSLSTSFWNECVDTIIKGNEHSARTWFHLALNFSALLNLNDDCVNKNKSSKLQELWVELNKESTNSD